MTRKEILEKINNYNNKIQEKLNSFITGCYSLEEVSSLLALKPQDVLQLKTVRTSNFK